MNNGLPDNGIFRLISWDVSLFDGFMMLIADESSTLPPIRACWSFFLQEFGCWSWEYGVIECWTLLCRFKEGGGKGEQRLGGQEEEEASSQEREEGKEREEGEKAQA